MKRRQQLDRKDRTSSQAINYRSLVQLSCTILGNISLESLEQETSPFPIFCQLAATLLEECTNLLPTSAYFYDVRKPLDELKQELVQHIASLMDTPVESIRLDCTTTRLQVLRFLATEWKASKLSLMQAREQRSDQDSVNSPSTLNNSCSGWMTLYLDQLSALLNNGWVNDAKQAKSLIQLAKQRISSNCASLWTSSLPKYIREYIEENNDCHRQPPSNKILEIHRPIYWDYKNRFQLLTSRLQATCECFQSSERWTKGDVHKKYQITRPTRMFCTCDLYAITREDLDFIFSKTTQKVVSNK